jgi:hypothetical protein
VQQQARAAYEQFARDPYHPGLHFKPVHSAQPIYSARIGLGYRTLGLMRDDEIVWYWIGTHAEYDRMLKMR